MNHISGAFNSERGMALAAQPFKRRHRIRVLNHGQRMMTLVGDDLPALEERAHRIVADLRWRKAELEVVS